MSADFFDTPEHEVFRETVRKFAEDELAPRAREFDEKLGIQAKYMLFTAALLKDIGKVVLNRFVGETFQKINTLVQNRI